MQHGLRLGKSAGGSGTELGRAMLAVSRRRFDTCRSCLPKKVDWPASFQPKIPCQHEIDPHPRLFNLEGVQQRIDISVSTSSQNHRSSGKDVAGADHPDGRAGHDHCVAPGGLVACPSIGGTADRPSQASRRARRTPQGRVAELQKQAAES